MANSKLGIALAPGANHFCYIDNLINSIKNTTSIDVHFCILSPEEKLTLKNTENVTIKTISKKDLKLFQDLYCVEGKRGDIPPFVYSQILIPSYFQEYSKILFLEVDQVVRKDLKELLNYCLDNNINLGAVPVPNPKEVPDHFRVTHPGQNYYNCGVVFIDTNYWLENNLSEICFDECRKQKSLNGSYFRFYVQGAMNTGLSSHIKPLDLKYNFMGLGGGTGFSTEELDNAVILHWNGKRKPWADDGLYKDYYQI